MGDYTKFGERSSEVPTLWKEVGRPSLICIYYDDMIMIMIPIMMNTTYNYAMYH